MARLPARIVGGLPYDATLSDGHQPQYGHDGAREVLLPASLIVQPPEEPVAVTTSFAAEFRQNMRNAHGSVRSATSRAAKTQKNYFDKHVKGTPFALNKLVWLYWPRPLMRSRSRKLTRSWSGPWRIVESKPPSSSLCRMSKPTKNRPFMWIAWSPAVILCTTRSKKLWFLRRLAHVAVPAALPDCRTVISLNTRQLYHVLGLSGLPSPSNFTQLVSAQPVGQMVNLRCGCARETLRS